jgi:putative membrane protein
MHSRAVHQSQALTLSFLTQIKVNEQPGSDATVSRRGNKAMMYGWWEGSSAPGYGMIFGAAMMIVIVVMTILIIAWVLRAVGFGWHSNPPTETPLDVLKRRLACGEIDSTEYEQRKKLLTN